MHRTYEPHHDHHHGRQKPFRWWKLVPWVAAAYVLTGFYGIRTNQRGVVRRCGRVLAEHREPGLHFGFPWPVDRVDKVKVRESKRVGVGMSLSERVLGRKVQPQDAECLSGDRNLIVLSAVVQYRIADPARFLFRSADVPGLVSDTAAASLTSVVSGMTVDDVLTVERIGIQNRALADTNKLLKQYGTGVQVTSVSLEGVRPPEDVAAAFSDVTAARADRQRAINEAEGYANRLEPQARAEAEVITSQAEAYAEEVVKKAQGEADRFSQMAVELHAGRELTMKRLTLETLEEVLPRLKKIVVGSEGGGPVDLGIFEEKP